MLQIPSLTQDEFAVLLADGATGHVLSKSGTICLNYESEVYFIFKSIEQARLFIRQKQNAKNTLDGTIYNCNMELVEYLAAPQWKH